MGYTMSADEVTFWQDQAALLDPLAYEVHAATSGTATVPGGERWYLLNGWHLGASGAGTSWFHRPLDVDNAMMLSEGTVITYINPGGGGQATSYICKPSLVTGSDARYTDDPRGLYFERIMRMGTLTQYQIGNTATGSSEVNVSFPGGFTYGLLQQVSGNDVAWVILRGSVGAINTLNEISDFDPARFAQKVICPFDATVFTEIGIRGTSSVDGRGTVTYLKLPADW